MNRTIIEDLTGALARTLAAGAFVFLTSSASAAPGLRHVVIDPGHGGPNSGARNPFDRSHYEKEYTLIIAKMVTAHLRAEGVKVTMTRTEDVGMTLLNRVHLANRLRADLLMSIHLNATDIPGPSGHETFFLALKATDEATRRLVAFENTEGGTVLSAADAMPAKDRAVDDILLELTRERAANDAQRLAHHIQRRMIPASPFKNRGVLQAPFVVLMGASMPAVVCEIGFINHPKEGPYITSPEGRTRIARALADGILDFGRLVLAPQMIRGNHVTP